MCMGGYSSLYLYRVLFVCNYFLPFFFCSSHIYEMNTGDIKIKEITLSLSSYKEKHKEPVCAMRMH